MLILILAVIGVIQLGMIIKQNKEIIEQNERALFTLHNIENKKRT